VEAHMVEIPESYTIANQLNQVIKGKCISWVQVNQSPHSFAWYFGNHEEYNNLLSGKSIGNAVSYGSVIEIEAEDYRIVFMEGASPQYYDDLKKVPKKHQLYIEFDDQTALVCTIRMYGGLYAFREGENQNPYYLVAKVKPSPLSDEFDYNYFLSLRTEKTNKLSVKAFLATEQRIPGLGNGVLQDILLNAGIHPKRKVADISEAEFKNLFNAIKNTLKQMVEQGGRDTEKDLFGNEGGYKTLLSKKTLTEPCIRCGHEIYKENYLGGSIYYCANCQK